MKREFTATTYILNQRGEFLLLFHPKHQKWLPPGGHLEENETPEEAAKREVAEETGQEIEWLEPTLPHIDYWNARSLQTPFLTLLEKIPAYGMVEAHEHVDFIFLARAIEPLRFFKESEKIKWFSIEEISLLESDKEIFQETLDVIDEIYYKRFKKAFA